MHTSHKFIVFVDQKYQKTTYIYNYEEYLTYSHPKVYEMCVEAEDRVYLFGLSGSKRYEVEFYDGKSNKFGKLAVEGVKPLFKPDCVCYYNEKEK